MRDTAHMVIDLAARRRGHGGIHFYNGTGGAATVVVACVLILVILAIWWYRTKHQTHDRSDG